jgi:predicted GIY-YIG superfamily endonuclease
MRMSIKLPYVQSFRTRHGTMVFYFRKRGCKGARLRGLPSSAEFMRSYETALGNPKPIEIGARRAKARSVAAVSGMMQMYNRIAVKFASFLKSGSEPAGYLYRHYHPSGDLLYIGITQSVSERTKAHLFKASWKDFICLIVVEPFATREELLEAERDAIANEFPKYNRILNGHRHPVQELTRRQADEKRHQSVLARRAATEAATAAPTDTKGDDD